MLSCLNNSLRHTFLILDALSYLKRCQDAAYQRAYGGWDPLIQPIEQCLNYMGFGISFDLTLVGHYGLGLQPMIHRLAVILLRQHKRASQCSCSEGAARTSWESLLTLTNQACRSCEMGMDLNFTPEEEAECWSLLGLVSPRIS
jgi:hypothetical protein